MGQTSARVRLRTIAVPTPCRVSWDRMTGTHGVRHCESCRTNVYDLSEMSDEATEELLARSEDVCVRYYSRPDGTLVRTNCGDKPRRSAPAAAAGVAAMALASTTAFIGIDVAVDAPEVAQQADGERVLVACGMIKITMTPKAKRHRREPIVTDVIDAAVTSEGRLRPTVIAQAGCSDLWDCPPVDDSFTAAATVSSGTLVKRPSPWRHAWHGALGLLVALVAFVTRRRWSVGESR